MGVSVGYPGRLGHLASVGIIGSLPAFAREYTGHFDVPVEHDGNRIGPGFLRCQRQVASDGNGVRNKDL